MVTPHKEVFRGNFENVCLKQVNMKKGMETSLWIDLIEKLN